MRVGCRAYVARTQLDQEAEHHEMVVLDDTIPAIFFRNQDQILLHPKAYQALVSGSPLNLRIGKRFITVRLPTLTIQRGEEFLTVVAWELTEGPVVYPPIVR